MTGVAARVAACDREPHRRTHHVGDVSHCATIPAGYAVRPAGASVRFWQLAVERGQPGTYNIAEDDGAVAIAKARAQLGFDPTIRLDS